MFGQTITSHELGRRLDIALRDELGTPSTGDSGGARRFRADCSTSCWCSFSLAYMLIDGPGFFRYVLRFVPPEHRTACRVPGRQRSIACSGATCAGSWC